MIGFFMILDIDVIVSIPGTYPFIPKKVPKVTTTKRQWK